MPPKRRSPRTPKTRKASRRPRETPPASGVPHVLAREEEEGDAASQDGVPDAQGSHASALALSKIREALKGLSQEDLQSLVKGTSATRPPAGTVFFSLGVCPHYIALASS